MLENQLQIIESKEVRDQLIQKEEALEKIKAIPLFPGRMFVGTKQAANFYEVSEDAIKSVIRRNRVELSQDGLNVINGEELRFLKSEALLKDNAYVGNMARAFTVIPRRALLRIGMLLTTSTVAEKLREYLLNIEEEAPVEQKAVALSTMGAKNIEALNLKKANQIMDQNIRKEQLLAKQELNTVNKLIKKAELLGLNKLEAAGIIQSALLSKKDPEYMILKEIQTILDINAKISRGRINMLIDDIAIKYLDEDRQSAWHAFSDRMKTRIGINMKSIRERKKKKFGPSSQQVPSYLDLIADYKAWHIAEEVIKEWDVELSNIYNNSAK